MHPAAYDTAFEPRELAFLQRFFNQACAERGLAGSSHAANDLAVQIIGLYQKGIRDEKDLEGQLGGRPVVNS